MSLNVEVAGLLGSALGVNNSLVSVGVLLGVLGGVVSGGLAGGSTSSLGSGALVSQSLKELGVSLLLLEDVLRDGVVARGAGGSWLRGLLGGGGLVARRWGGRGGTLSSWSFLSFLGRPINITYNTVVSMMLVSHRRGSRRLHAVKARQREDQVLGTCQSLLVWVVGEIC